MSSVQSEERNQYQITRKDAKNCFVESLSDAFEIGKIHFVFATYDISKPVGQRQTDNVNIYISVDEFIELHRKVTSGELRFLLQNKKKSGDRRPLFESLGGTSAERLAKQKHPRADGKSLSRTMQLVCGQKSDFLLVANSGPGDTNEKGLIVPRFGTRPENHVAVSMTFETFAELILMTYVHYVSWLSAFYGRQNRADKRQPQGNSKSQSDTDDLSPF